MRYEKGSFIVIPNKESLDGIFSHLQVVYMWICSYADEKGVCFPSRTTIAKNSGCSVKTVDRAIDGLCEIGFLKKLKRVENGKNLTNIYQIMLVEPLGSVPQSLPSVPQSLPSVPQSPGVASQSRTELNPVLTKSTYLGELEIRAENDKPIREKKDTAYLKVFELWNKYPINWRTNTTQIAAAKNLLAEQEFEDIDSALKYYFKHKGDDWIPEILTPSDLDRKWLKLEAFYDKKHG